MTTILLITRTGVEIVKRTLTDLPMDLLMGLPIEQVVTQKKTMAVAAPSLATS